MQKPHKHRGWLPAGWLAGAACGGLTFALVASCLEAEEPIPPSQRSKSSLLPRDIGSQPAAPMPTAPIADPSKNGTLPTAQPPSTPLPADRRGPAPSTMPADLTAEATAANGDLPARGRAEELWKFVPFESLAERLAYEQGKGTAVVKLAPDVAERLAAEEAAINEMLAQPDERIVWGRAGLQPEAPLSDAELTKARLGSLVRLYNANRNQFFSLEDKFGLSRIPTIPLDYIRLPEPVPLVMGSDNHTFCRAIDDSRPTPEFASAAPPPVPSRGELIDYHREQALAFFNVPGWGLFGARANELLYAKEHALPQRAAAGFQAHGFRRPLALLGEVTKAAAPMADPVVPTEPAASADPFAATAKADAPLPAAPAGESAPTSESAPATDPAIASDRPPLSAPGVADCRTWKVEKIQLVSMLLRDEPQVYVSYTLPQMQSLQKEAVRDLDPFERSALEKLRSGDDLVVDTSTAERIRMFGSLRATKYCLECHAVERGTLLGAFSYDLRPTCEVTPPPLPPTEVVPPTAAPPAVETMPPAAPPAPRISRVFGK